MFEGNDMTHNKNKKILIPLCIIAVIFIMSAIVMWLWNAILPDVLHVSTISYWQAMGIFVLCKILFGGYAGKGRKSRFFRSKHELNHGIHDLSPDSKMKLQGEWRKRCEARFKKEEDDQSQS
jgi:fucose permease